MIPSIIRRSKPAPPPLELLPVPNPKPRLTMTPIPTFVVTGPTLARYIFEVFRFEPFLIPAGTYRVEGRLASRAWERRAHRLRCGQRECDVGLILQTLAADRFIPSPATYIIVE